jgi:hypothetical protein
MIRERDGAAPYLRVASEAAHPQHQRQPFLNAVVVVGCSTAGGRTIRRPTRTSRSLSAGCPPRSIRRPTRSWWRVATRRKPPLPFSPGLDTAGVVAACRRDVRGFKPAIG